MRAQQSHTAKPEAPGPGHGPGPLLLSQGVSQYITVPEIEQALIIFPGHLSCPSPCSSASSVRCQPVTRSA
eukprot:760537-Hanusia_phi.AAC.2